MQKKLIALAVTAAFSAPAFADTTVYGVVDAAFVNISATGHKSNMQVVSGGLASSRLGVVAAEDLDNGMKAIAKVEYKLDGAVSDGVLAARQEMLALAGGFGTVAAGYLQTAGYDWEVKFDPTAGSAVSPLQAVTANSLGANNTFYIGTAGLAARANRALAYISPDMGGVTVAVNYATNVFDTNAATLGANANPATTGNKTTATLLSATYAAGPLAVGGVYLGTANDDTGYNKRTEMALGASYDLGPAKLFATYQTGKTDNGLGTDKAISVSVVAPVGPGAIAGSYAKNTQDSTAATNDNDSAMTVAYLMGLSKTTTAYGALHKMSFGGATNLDVTVVALGVNKKF